MRTVALITLFSILHLSSATIDVQTLSKAATTKLQTLADQATNTIHGVTDSIDIDKVKQLDFLNLIPRIQERLNHQGPSHLDKIKYYLEQIKGLSANDLVLAFDAH